MVSAAEQQIDLGAFYHEFIPPGRGSAEITAEVEDPEFRLSLVTPHFLGSVASYYYPPVIWKI
jgi:hypothetical protein